MSQKKKRNTHYEVVSLAGNLAKENLLKKKVKIN